MTSFRLTADATSIPLKAETAACIVTSPPYNLGIEYENYDDNLDWFEYEYDLARPAAQEMFRVIQPSGRVWVNVMQAVPQKDRSDRFPLGVMWHDALNDAGFLYRDTIVWQQDNHDGQCAWGSWLMPSAPNLRGSYEVIHCFYKPPYKRTGNGRLPRDELGGDWTDLCRNVWKMNPVRRTENAPAPFPIELPARAIRLSTWPGEVVLDPFVGSGTTLTACEELGRIGIGIELGGTT